MIGKRNRCPAYYLAALPLASRSNCPGILGSRRSPGAHSPWHQSERWFAQVYDPKGYTKEHFRTGPRPPTSR